MRFRLTLFLLGAGLAFGAADKSLPIEQSSNDLVEIQASYLDKDQAKSELGTETEGIVVVRVRVRPLSDKPVTINRDDFMLLDTYDGQRSGPYAPSQIAGNSSLVVGSLGTRGGFGGMNNGPVWGGLGGGIGRMPGNGGGVGNTSSGTTQATSTVKSDDKAPESPLLKTLKEKVLPEKSVTDPVSGLLYFQIDGKKIKPKDLELYYKTPSGRLALRFHP